VAAVVATSGTGGAPKLVELGADAIRWSAVATSAALAPGRGPLAVLRARARGGRAGRWSPGPGTPASRSRSTSASTPPPCRRRRPGDPGLAGPGHAAPAAGRRRRGGPVPPGPARRRPRPRRPGRRRHRPGVGLVRTYGLTETFGGMVHDGHPLDGAEVRIATPRARCWSGGRCCSGGTGATRADRGRAPRRLAAHRRPGPVGPDGGWPCWAGATTWSSAAGSTSTRTRSRRCWPPTRAWPRPPWPAGPTPSGARRVAAFVVPRDPASPPTLAELRAFTRRRLAAAKAPRELVLVPALPRGPLGQAPAAGCSPTRSGFILPERTRDRPSRFGGPRYHRILGGLHQHAPGDLGMRGACGLRGRACRAGHRPGARGPAGAAAPAAAARPARARARRPLHAPVRPRPGTRPRWRRWSRPTGPPIPRADSACCTRPTRWPSASTGPAADQRRAVHHPPGGRGRHLGRARHGHHHPGRGPAPRHRGGHRLHPGADPRGLRRRDQPTWSTG
jgi:O-succinylbenzoic acid--CoA ligase